MRIKKHRANEAEVERERLKPEQMDRRGAGFDEMLKRVKALEMTIAEIGQAAADTLIEQNDGEATASVVKKANRLPPGQAKK